MQYNTIVIGGGVAGLTAGLYLGRANVSCLIIENKFWGGQTAQLNKVDNYPAMPNTDGFTIANNLLSQVKQFKVDLALENVASVSKKNSKFSIVTNKQKYTAENVIIATGAKTGMLGLDSEKRFIGKGVSYCATCDGNFFKNKTVAVIGRGKTAIEDIKYLHNLVDKIYWIIPDRKLSTTVLENLNSLDKLEIKYSSEVVEMVGDITLQGIKIYNTKTFQNSTITADGAFISLGRMPELSWLEIDLKKNKDGYLLTNKNCQTSHKGIFACGDITARELKQIVTACSDGAIASSYIISKR